MTKGRTDVMIKCQKVGNNYIQRCNEKRDYYKRSDIKDPMLLNAIKDVKNLFDDGTPIMQKAAITKKIEVVPTPQVEEVKEQKEEIKSLLIKKEDII